MVSAHAVQLSTHTHITPILSDISDHNDWDPNYYFRQAQESEHIHWDFLLSFFSCYTSQLLAITGLLVWMATFQGLLPGYKYLQMHVSLRHILQQLCA